MQKQKIHVVDNDALVLTRFAASEPKRGISVIVGSAAGAPQTYYQSFCEFLARHGFDVFSFDFRGIAQSQMRDIKTYRDIGFFAWANHDYPAVIEYVKAQHADQPLYIVGHSVGGWMPGFTKASDKLDGILGVAALSGYWRLMAVPTRYLHFIAWHALVPLSVRLFGYWPGAVGLGRDTPAGLAHDFGYCAKRPNFIFDNEQINARVNVQRFKGKLHLFQIGDDPWGTPASVASLAQQFVCAQQVEIEAIQPRDFGLSRIGHVNFFRREHETTLWPYALTRLNQLIG